MYDIIKLDKCDIRIQWIYKGLSPGISKAFFLYWVLTSVFSILCFYICFCIYFINFASSAFGIPWWIVAYLSVIILVVVVVVIVRPNNVLRFYPYHMS